MKPIVKDIFFLQQASAPATPEDRHIGQELRATLLANSHACVGLAANMIGYHKRVIIIDLGLTSLVMYNPVVLSKSGLYQTEEGCLSLVGTRPTQRFREITVRFLDESWQEQELTLTDFSAQICQHELDHLEGIVI